jgi:signal transduction histidine kinase
VRIEGKIDGGSGLLRIVDDGRGFDPQADPQGRYGLIGMGERAAGIGAELDIDAEPGAGTTITVTWDAP